MTCEVKYSYNYVKFKDCWVPKEEMLALDYSNVVSYEQYSRDAAEELKMDEKDFRARYTLHRMPDGFSDQINFDTMPLRRWNADDSKMAK